MLNTFRQSMTWLHTWCGLVVGWVLFAIFFSGTLAVFRQEIDYWMMPELHGPMSEVALPAVAQRVLQDVAPTAARWQIDLPGHRVPVLRLRWSATAQDRLQTRYIDQHGTELSPRATGGGAMIYRFHYGLLMGRTGMWIVGAMAMAMLVALVTGVIIHAKIFREFFTFRPRRPAPRAWLDAHTVSSVVVLPFSLMITYSGLVIWWFIWMPGGLDLAYSGERAAFFRDMAPAGFSRSTPSDQRAPLADLAQVVRVATSMPPGDLSVAAISVSSPGLAHARIEVARFSQDALWGVGDRLRFDGVSGALIDRLPESGAPAYVAHRIFRILHEIKFAGPWLRWIFFVMSAVSCTMIATGTVLWGTKRRVKHVKVFAAGDRSRAGALVGFGVDVMNVGVIAGLCTATSAYFLANRLLPAGMVGRADIEVAIFFLAWLACGGAAVGYLMASHRHFTSVERAQTAMRRLWGLQWTVAAMLAALVAPIDETMTRGISRAVVQGDGVVLAFHATALVAALGMAWAAWMSLRPLDVQRGSRS
jgi:uncharacterized iron-regulated membrane protein